MCGLLFACATAPAPDSGRSLFSGSEDREAPGIAVVQAELGLVDDDALEARVRRIGASVVGSEAARFGEPTFDIVDQPVANVFSSLPNHVFVTRGLLALVTDEAELANLIAHELAHLAAGDVARAAGVPALGVGSAVMQAAIEHDGPPRFALGAELVGRYPERSEALADALGQRNAAAAGMDAAAFARALRTLGVASSLDAPPESLPDFATRHPSSPGRIAEAGERADALAERNPPAEPGAQALDWLEGLRVGPNPEYGVFVGSRFLNHAGGYSVRLPRGWQRLHSRTAVGAVAPNGRAQLSLERQGDARSPDQAAAEFLSGLSERLDLQELSRESLRTGGVPSCRVVTLAATPGGNVRLEFTWFVLPTGVFRMLASSATSGAEKLEVSMRNAARSFKRLGDREREGIPDVRLRFVTANAGDTLGRLAEAHGNVWPVPLLAAVNGVAPDAPLPSGRRIRIAQRGLYDGRQRGADPVAR